MKSPFARASALAVFLTSICTFSMAKTSHVYIATQDAAPNMGVLLADFDSDSGTFSTPKLVVQTPDPAHFTISPDGRHLYMCNTGTPGGVSAFAIDRTTGGLSLLNHRPAEGRGPSYVSMDQTGRFVLDANYGGGYVEVFAANADGSLGERTAFVQHHGKGVHPERQTKPYAHWIGTDPSNKFALAADLGIDQILVYRFDAQSGKLSPNNPAFTKTQPGMGPRHLMFHPNGKWVYAIEELGNAVTAFAWDGAHGTLTELQTIGMLPEDFKDTTKAAEIAIHNSGRFLYASNRGHDSIVVYAIEEATGKLTLKQRLPSGGKTPRYFTLDPTHRWLIVGNQDSDNIVVFAVDGKTGELAPKGEPLRVIKPYGISF